MRVVRLKDTFFVTRRVYSAQGTALDAAVRLVLRSLTDSRYPVPGPKDEVVLRTPFQTIWARSVPNAQLIVTYLVENGVVEVLSVRPIWNDVK